MTSEPTTSIVARQRLWEALLEEVETKDTIVIGSAIITLPLAAKRLLKAQIEYCKKEVDLSLESNG